ncbi:NAD(P)/FAD-dependent oxidoreductase [Cryobacterium melibiosiphilum]|uniref:NAD(P)/FAD-dependent oxidoreductase n=3 Tax=Cryobacterium melibiosiphilum TaxID=995039 RepID=A0A3A5MQ26_9MICO|nr:NAD(P)/FAD-dependent oxidoreductase [Cryobacterium melibiosiphilum]RJT91211.1 NAD(P)/FAD-dependent oxidoreductase [Cryobacterium melibiosiphilum]
MTVQTPVPSTDADTWDVIVLGAGAVGENVADRTAQGGLRTVIVESSLIGGECSYWACMPSKALLRSGAVLAAAQRVPGAAEAVTSVVDPRATLKRRDTIVNGYSDAGQANWLESAGIDLVRGHGTLTGPREVTVTAADGSVRVLTASHAVVVSTGSAALLPEVPGLAGVEPWTSREATSVTEIPTSLAIIGGGAVAAEMATAYTALGSHVTLIARSGLLGGSEPFAGELVATALRDSGATLLLDESPTAARRTDTGDVELTLASGGTVTASEVLVATGRVPNTGGLGLATVGLVDGDWLTVDDTLRVVGESLASVSALGTGRPGSGWLYAAGDVNHRALLTHQGKYQARAVGDVIVARAAGAPVDDKPWGSHVATADHSAVPQVIFTDPEVASVGLTAAAAVKAGYRVRILDYDLSSLGGSTVLADDYVGHARAIVDLDREVLIGVTFVGQDVAELLHSATIAVVAEVPIDRLWHAVPSYPTLSEVWLRLLEAYGRPGHVD